jgi:hypothetical protein
MLLLLGGSFFGESVGSQEFQNPLYYVSIPCIITAVLIQYRIHRKLERDSEKHKSEIHNLGLRIKILELENRIRVRMQK